MGGDEGFFMGTTSGLVTGAVVGALTGTFTTFWSAAQPGTLNRAQLVKQVVPSIASNVGFMAGVGGTFKAGEALMATWTGKDDEAVNSAFGGFSSGMFIGFRSGSVPMMVATGAGCALMATILHLNGKTLRGGTAH